MGDAYQVLAHNTTAEVPPKKVVYDDANETHGPFLGRYAKTPI